MFRDRIPGAGKTKWVAAARCFVTKPSVLGIYLYIYQVIRISMCVCVCIRIEDNVCEFHIVCVCVCYEFMCINIRSVSAAVAAK